MRVISVVILFALASPPCYAMYGQPWQTGSYGEYLPERAPSHSFGEVDLPLAGWTAPPSQVAEEASSYVTPSFFLPQQQHHDQQHHYHQYEVGEQAFGGGYKAPDPSYGVPPSPAYEDYYQHSPHQQSGYQHAPSGYSSDSYPYYGSTSGSHVPPTQQLEDFHLHNGLGDHAGHSGLQIEEKSQAALVTGGEEEEGEQESAEEIFLREWNNRGLNLNGDAQDLAAQVTEMKINHPTVGFTLGTLATVLVRDNTKQNKTYRTKFDEWAKTYRGKIKQLKEVYVKHDEDYSPEALRLHLLANFRKCKKKGSPFWKS